MNQYYKKTKHHIRKSSGEFEFFSPTKLQHSIERTGIRPKTSKQITNSVSKIIQPGSSTKEIFDQTIKLIRKESPIAAIHYSLKKSILELGPTGYEFEFFVSKYFKSIGFDTYTGIVLQGKFVRHEVDIVASKPNYQVYTECKFHNNAGRKNDIKIVLYVKARWDDLKDGPDGKYLREYYVASNTAFTKDAIAYAEGCGLKLLGVNAPENESFLDKIKRLKLYPITSLKRLKTKYRKELLAKKIILCEDLVLERKLLLQMGMPESEILIVFKDIQKILSNGNEK
jgi:hypothetical protein